MFVLTIEKKNWCAPHYGVSRRDGEVMGRAGGGRGTSRGVSWMCCWMVGWLACAVVLVMLVVGDPICVGAGTFPSSCLMGGPCTHMNMASLMVLGWLLTSLCTMLNWLGSMGWPVVELCRCMGEGTLKCSLILSPSVLPDSPIYELVQLVCGHW